MFWHSFVSCSLRLDFFAFGSSWSPHCLLLRSFTFYPSSHCSSFHHLFTQCFFHFNISSPSFHPNYLFFALFPCFSFSPLFHIQNTIQCVSFLFINLLFPFLKFCPSNPHPEADFLSSFSPTSHFTPFLPPFLAFLLLSPEW